MALILYLALSIGEAKMLQESDNAAMNENRTLSKEEMNIIMSTLTTEEKELFILFE